MQVLTTPPEKELYTTLKQMYDLFERVHGTAIVGRITRTAARKILDKYKIAEADELSAQVVGMSWNIKHDINDYRVVYNLESRTWHVYGQVRERHSLYSVEGDKEFVNEVMALRIFNQYLDSKK